MPFNELPRRDSWPPTIIRLDSSSSSNNDEITSAQIDENPFAFFLTSPEDIDEYMEDEDLDAGIEGEGKEKVREVSPSSLQRVRFEDEVEDEMEFGMAVPLTLKEFTNRAFGGRTGARKEEKEKREDVGLGLGLGISIPAQRGRAKVRLVQSRNGRGRGQTRSLSVRRNQSWREPSRNIWSIDEAEEEEGGEKEEKRGEEMLSVSAPPSTVIGSMEEMMSRGQEKKVKKRVHWAF